MDLLTDIYKQVISRDNLYASASGATKGKRFKNAVSRFNFLREREIERLRRDLFDKTYRPGAYWLFKIHDPKEREIAASPFRDRVVHHAIHDVIEPLIDKTFIFDSYACRKGKGTHKALDRAQQFLRANKYCLHGDIRKYFPSIDHAVLKKIVRFKVRDGELLELIDQVIDSSNSISPHEPKSQIYRTSQGIKFLGLRLFHDHRRLASNNVRRLRRRLHLMAMKV